MTVQRQRNGLQAEEVAPVGVQGQRPVGKGEADPAQGIGAQRVLALPAALGAQQQGQRDIAQRSLRRRWRVARAVGGRPRHRFVPVPKDRDIGREAVQPFNEERVAQQAPLLGRRRAAVEIVQERRQRRCQAAIPLRAGVLQQPGVCRGGVAEELVDLSGRRARGAEEPVQ